jgi:luciferase family oxidoreductase group 1
MVELSILDLAPITDDGDAATALRNSRDLARHAERWGYRRFWLAEHHGMPGIASAATAVAIAWVAEGTTRIRVGAGGIMLPNHAPLVIAEQFGTLAALFPGRIDLGLGRAPGTDQITAHALRRTLASDPERFAEDVLELMAYLRDPEPGQRVVAVPGAGSHVPIWILGSSLFGAHVAAALGLPFAFASHFAPADLMPALETYRAKFQASAEQPHPRVMLGFNVIAADTEDEARLLATSPQQAFVNLRTGRPSRLPAPKAGYYDSLPAPVRGVLDEVLQCSAIGTPATVHEKIEAFVRRTAADELMVTAMIHDHAKRLRSFELTADVMGARPIPS